MLKALMLRKKIQDKQATLESLRATAKELEKREKDLETAITEAKTELTDVPWFCNINGPWAATIVVKLEVWLSHHHAKKWTICTAERRFDFRLPVFHE